MQGIQRLIEPLVHLRPGHWKVILHKDGDHESQLLVAALRQDHILRVIDHLQQLTLYLNAKLVRQRPFALITPRCAGSKSNLLHASHSGSRRRGPLIAAH